MKRVQSAYTHKPKKLSINSDQSTIQFNSKGSALFSGQQSTLNTQQSVRQWHHQRVGTAQSQRLNSVSENENYNQNNNNTDRILENKNQKINNNNKKSVQLQNSSISNFQNYFSRPETAKSSQTVNINTQSYLKNQEIPEQNKEHRYYLNERPTTAKSFKFLFLTETETNPSQKLLAKQKEEKEQMTLGKRQSQKIQLEKDIKLINNVLHHHKKQEYIENNASQIDEEDQEKDEELYKQMTSTGPNNELERQWNTYMQLKNNITNTYDNDFQNYMPDQSEYKQKRRSLHLMPQELKEYNLLIEREQKFKQFKKDYENKFKQQKEAAHDYLKGEKVDNNLIYNYKQLLKPKLVDRSNKVAMPFKKKLKEQEIKSKVHKKMGFPGYKDTHESVKSDSKVKIKNFLQNFMKGEQIYFNTLGNISKSVSSEFHTRVELNKKCFMHHIFQPEKQFQTAEDLQLGSKNCKILQEQQQLQEDLKQFDCKLKHKEKKIRVKPQSPKHNLNKAQLTQQAQDQQQKLNQIRYQDNRHSIIKSMNSNIRMSMGNIHNFRKSSIDSQKANKNHFYEEQKVQQLKLIKEFVEKYTEFSKNYIFKGNFDSKEDQQRDMEFKQQTDIIQKMIKSTEETIQIIDDRQFTNRNIEPLDDFQKSFLFSVKHNELEKVTAYLKINKERLFQAKDITGQSALHLAAKRGHLEMIDLLITKGAFFYQKDIRQRTPKQVAHKIHGERNKIFKNLNGFEGEYFKRRKQVRPSGLLQDLGKIQKKFRGYNLGDTQYSINSLKNDSIDEMYNSPEKQGRNQKKHNQQQKLHKKESISNNSSSNSECDFLDQNDQPFRQKIIERREINSKI